jgi:V8-like Glu-specific endopeptidase
VDSEQPRLTWSDEIVFPGATYIAPFFSQFELAPGDFVVVRSPDGTQSWTYHELGRGDLGRSGGFYSTRIRGERALVELWTQGTKSAFGYSIDHFARGYSAWEIEDLWARGLGEELNLPEPEGTGESTCTTNDLENAICYETSEAEIYDHSRSVARLLIQGSFLCTGWLIGDEGHLMTNEHCIEDQSDASNTDYEFMSEGATCGQICPQLGCDGTIEATSATLIQDSSSLDYALVELTSATDLPTTYGFMRLRETGPLLAERIYIPQHPAGRAKEIAVESTYPDDAGGFPTTVSLSESTCSGGLPEVGYWADTEGGSSGSPVLSYDDHLVVALHHCRGSAFCTSGTGSDDPNRGVDITLIIADLGANLPNNAVSGPEIFSDGFESGNTSMWAP